MSKLTRRERSAINKAKFRAERGGYAEMRGGETTHRYDRESEASSPRLTRRDRIRIRAKEIRNEWRRMDGPPIPGGVGGLSVPSGWIDLNNGDDPYMFQVIKGKVYAHSIGGSAEWGPYPSYESAVAALRRGAKPSSGDFDD